MSIYLPRRASFVFLLGFAIVGEQDTFCLCFSVFVRSISRPMHLEIIAPFSLWNPVTKKTFLSRLTTPWVKKGCHLNHGYNFVNSWWICKFFSLLQRAVNFQQNQYNVTHHTLSMLLHYLGKLKNQKFALLMHVKHVSNVTFYHLFNRQKKCQMSLK